MTIYAQKNLFGTQVQVGSDYAVDIASGDFSAALGTWTNNDGAYPDAPKARVTVQLPAFGSAPALGEVVELWGVQQDTEGTNDDTGDPGGTNENQAEFYTAFEVLDATSLQRITRTVDVDGKSKVKFFLRNLTGQNLNNDGATPLKLWIQPFTDGVSA